MEVAQSLAGILTVDQSLKLAVGLNAPVFAHAEEDDPVDGTLDGEIELALGEAGIAKGQIAGKRVTPGFNLLEKGRVEISIVSPEFDEIPGDYLKKSLPPFYC